MKTFTAIDSDRALYEFLKYINATDIGTLAIDFEGESNLHVYGEKLCLIQVFDGTRYFAIDPFKIGRDALAEFLESKRIVKLFYGSESDLSLVFKQYGIKIKSVLDLKVLVDVLDLEKKGLDSVIGAVLKIGVVGKEKYQMYNWTLRPIRPEALEYALTDVEHLFALRDELMKRILAGNKHMELLYGLVRNRNEFDGKSVPTIFKSNEYKNLRSGEKDRLKDIYELRDGIAQRLNFPPNVVLDKRFLFLLAKGEIGIDAIGFAQRMPEKAIRETVSSLKELVDRWESRVVQSTNPEGSAK